MKTTLLLLLSCFILQPATITTAEIIRSEGWTVEYIFDSMPGTESGAICLLISPAGDTLFQTTNGRGLFSFAVGGAYPSLSQLVQTGDQSFAVTSIAFRDMFGIEFPLLAHTDINFSRDEIVFDHYLTVSGNLRFEKGYSLAIPLGFGARLDFMGATGDTSSITLFDQPLADLRRPFTNLIGVQDGANHLQIVLRNPLNPVPNPTADALLLELLIAKPSNSTHMRDLKNICSILLPGDTIRASWSIPAVNPNGMQRNPTGNFAFFSAQPHSAEQSIILAFDELPDILPPWTVPTNSENLQTPVSSNLLSLLDLYPDVKFTYLLVLDDIQKMTDWFWPSWWPPGYSTKPDSLEVHSGRYSAKMTVPDVAGYNSAHMLPIVPVEPGKRYSVGAFIKPFLGSGGWVAIHAIAYASGSSALLGDGELVPMGDDWQPFEFEFDSNDAGLVTVNFYITGRAADLYFDDAYCIEVGGTQNRVVNSSLEDFRPFIIYDPPDEKIWPNARSVYRFATEATPEYKNWLRQIQNDDPAWPYSRQIGVGLHGLHHTPDSNFVLFPQYPQHEFDLFQPRFDSIRIAHIVEDVISSGLDPHKVLSLFRFPGHRHTESVLPPLFRNYFRIIDHGIVYNGESYFGRIHRFHKMLWTTNSQSWFDVAHSSVAYLKEGLDRGSTILTGTHYNIFAAVGTPGARENAINLLGWLENDYPFINWFQGEEVAPFWDELNGINSIRQDGFGNSLSLTWRGASVNGETVIVLMAEDSLAPVSAYVDERPVAWIKRGSRVFIELPRLPYADHRLDLKLASGGTLLPAQNNWSIRLLRDNVLEISNLSLSIQHYELGIYDLQGRRIFQRKFDNFGSGSLRFQIPMQQLPSGQMFMRLSDGERNMVKMIGRVK
jgi:hypothetical protein